MAGPYDTVVSIGGQSFVDGLWRMLGPALEGLTNPLPVSLPGFTNATMRVTQIVPVLPASGALQVLAKVELGAEALLHVLTSTGSVNIALGEQVIALGGALALPQQVGSLTNILLGGGGINLGPGTGEVRLPPVTGTLTGDGTIAPGQLALPPIPLPAIVPMAVDLTPTTQLLLPAAIKLAAFPPSPATRFSLAFIALDVSLGTVGGIDPNLAATLTAKLQAAVTQIATQLGLPAGVQPNVDQAIIEDLVAPIPNLVAAAFDDALSRLIAETGRLIYPPAGGGASCGALLLPTEADVQLDPVNDASYVLHIGFKRPTSTDIADFPAFTPDAIECQVTIGNTVLMRLLCCLVEQLPAFVFPQTAIADQVDVTGQPHTLSYNFFLASVALGPITLDGGRGDGVSVCLDGDLIKYCSLVGRFKTSVPNIVPILSSIDANIATIELKFTLSIEFNLDDVAALANLRFYPVPQIKVTVSPSIPLMLAVGAVLALVVAGSGSLLGSLLGPLLGGGVSVAAAVGLVFALGYIVSGVVSFLLRKAATTVLSGASLLRSPPAIPPGLFDAFGRLSPATVEVDDLVARGVLHTPTSPWGLLPRIGLARPRQPGGTGTSTTHPRPSGRKKGGRADKAG